MNNNPLQLNKQKLITREKSLIDIGIEHLCGKILTTKYH